MSIISVTQKHQDEPFSQATGSFSIPRIYQVITDDINTSEPDILNATGLPKLGDSLSGVSNIYVTQRQGKKSVIKLSNGLTGAAWEVSIVYEKKQPGSGSDGTPASNLNKRLINFSMDFNAVEEIIEKAYDTGDSFGNPSKPIQNAAGMPFENPPKDVRYNMVLRWTQKDSSFSFSNLEKAVGTINKSSEKILGVAIPAGCGCIRKISPALKIDDDGDAYYETSYEVEVDRQGFDVKVRNRGFQRLNGGKLVDILKSDLNSTEPAEKIEDAADLTNAGALNLSGTPVYLTFQTKYKTSWSGLNLISSIS